MMFTLLPLAQQKGRCSLRSLSVVSPPAIKTYFDYPRKRTLLHPPNFRLRMTISTLGEVVWSLLGLMNPSLGAPGFHLRCMRLADPRSSCWNPAGWRSLCSLRHSRRGKHLRLLRPVFKRTQSQRQQVSNFVFSEGQVASSAGLSVK